MNALKTKHIIALSAATMVSCIYAKTAFSEPPPLKDDGSTLTFIWENDALAGTDRNYTNGIRASWLSGTREPSTFARFIAKTLGADDDALFRRGLALGHSIFTPENTETEDFLPNQHPYAGWLYLEYTPVIQQRDQVDQFSFRIGILGPSAQGEWVQNNFHNLIGVDEALGWDNQLRDEITLSVAWDRKFRRLLELDLGVLKADVTPTVGFKLGTIQTNVHVGGMLRVGTDLRSDYGPPRIRPSLSGTGFIDPSEKFGGYFFVGVEGRLVPYNRFFDGSIFRSDAVDLTREPFTGDLQTGIALQYKKTQIALTAVYRLKEFSEQTQAQAFGALSISRRF